MMRSDHGTLGLRPEKSVASSTHPGISPLSWPATAGFVYDDGALAAIYTGIAAAVQAPANCGARATVAGSDHAPIAAAPSDTQAALNDWRRDYAGLCRIAEPAEARPSTEPGCVRLTAWPCIPSGESSGSAAALSDWRRDGCGLCRVEPDAIEARKR